MPKPRGALTPPRCWGHIKGSRKQRAGWTCSVGKVQGHKAQPGPTAGDFPSHQDHEYCLPLQPGKRIPGNQDQLGSPLSSLCDSVGCWPRHVRTCTLGLGPGWGGKARLSRGPEKNGEGSLRPPGQSSSLDWGQGVKAAEQAVSEGGPYKQFPSPRFPGGSSGNTLQQPQCRHRALCGPLGSQMCICRPKPTAQCSAEGSHGPGLPAPTQGHEAWESGTRQSLYLVASLSTTVCRL